MAMVVSAVAAVAAVTAPALVSPVGMEGMVATVAVAAVMAVVSLVPMEISVMVALAGVMVLPTPPVLGAAAVRVSVEQSLSGLAP